MKFTFTLLFTFGLFPIFAQENPASKEINEAIREMDAGNLTQSRVILEEVLQKDSTNYDAWYEYAYSYYMQKDYAKAVQIMQTQTDHPEATDQLWQMIGNSQDIMGNSEEALATYAKGLERFPHSGRLFVESGNIFLIKGETEKAIPYYEKGIQMDPEFPSNYYRLARIYCNSPNNIWGLIYGEIFMNLERNTQRTREMSAILYATYQNAFLFGKDGVGTSFAQDMSPFTKAFESTMANAAAQYQLSQFPVHLFEFWQSIDDMNFFEAYNYWIFNQAPNDQFEKWRKDNATDFGYFVKWYNPNPIVITEKNYFSRNKLLN
ncbi:MAG: tetratricopeptide repeat protein [Cryomorphaceae bacterium]|nr:tetratricopeptide repeat protein [Cryomorphaceae bacterium]